MIVGEPPAYHVVFCTHGFWLPNDPRGSHSTTVRATRLRAFGGATTTDEDRSVAAVPHDPAVRRAAKQALAYPEVVLDGPQAACVGKGFARMVHTSGYVVHACAILPSHVHLVMLRHRYPVAQVVRLLRQAGTRQLLADGRHPLSSLRRPGGRLPSLWAQDYWKTFLHTEGQIADRIAYVEDNPVKEGKPRQHWSFVTPFTVS